MKKKSAVVFFAVMLAALAAFVPSKVAADESYGVCYAFTTCPRGGYIQCRVQGNSSGGVACNWSVIAGQSVECNGFVFVPGIGWMWQNYYFTCY